MYNNLSMHAARAMSEEIRRSAQRPERLMAAELKHARKSRRRRWRTQ